MGDFVNCDRGEDAEHENYATCLFAPFGKTATLQSTSNNTRYIIGGQTGRFNFWQPINNQGVLHLLVRIRYQLDIKESSTEFNATAIHQINKRESFRAPIERAPNGNDSSQHSSRTSTLLKHQVWLVDSCDSDVPATGRLLTHLSPTGNGGGGIVDVDAEIAVSQFNLTGTNAITNKYLLLNLPDGIPVGCCSVSQTDNLPASELDNLPSVSVVQPQREDLLPERLLKGEGSSAGGLLNSQTTQATITKKSSSEMKLR